MRVGKTKLLLFYCEYTLFSTYGQFAKKSQILCGEALCPSFTARNTEQDQVSRTLPPSLRPGSMCKAFTVMAPSPGQFVQVGKDSLRDALDEVVVEAEGVDADQQGDGVPGNVHQIVVAQVQVLQGLQEVLGLDEGGGGARAEIHINRSPTQRKVKP